MSTENTQINEKIAMLYERAVRWQQLYPLNLPRVGGHVRSSIAKLDCLPFHDAN